MVKPYSMDLRERVVAAVKRDGLSRQEAARRFGVAASTSITWVKRLESAFTIRGLVLELAERGLSVSYRAVWDFVYAEKLSYKKNRSRGRAGPSGRLAASAAVAKISGNG